MAVSTDPAALVAASACFNCLTPKQRDIVNTYLLAVAAGGSTDPAVLLAEAQQACFGCLTPSEHQIVQTYLYMILANA